MKTALHRYISVFDKNSEGHVADLDFSTEPDLETLRSIFNTEPHDPMYDEFPIDLRIAGLLELSYPVNFQFDFSRYQYFLSCDSQ